MKIGMVEISWWEGFATFEGLKQNAPERVPEFFGDPGSGLESVFVDPAFVGY